MAKALITNRIYLDNPGKEATKKIVKELSYKFLKKRGSSTIAVTESVNNYKILSNGILSIPQARIDLIPEHYEIIDKRIYNSVPFPKPNYSLFPEQQVVYDEVNDNAIINALVGWGKSYTALWIAHKLGQKTLIITHTTALREQWEDNVKALFGMDPGIIGSGSLDYLDSAIVVANTQTLVKHYNKIEKEFGLIILDEAHHTSASSFTTILNSMHARYKLGLSGTLIRKDGKHILFPDYFGKHVIKPPQSNTLNPRIKLVQTNIRMSNELTWADRISALVNDVNYQKFVANLAKGQIAKGHCVLVIADRVEFLKTVSEQIGDRCVLVTGELGDRELAKQQILNNEKDCIVGSRQLFSEGISIERLSCVILAVPINNDSLLEQIIGRIQRKYNGFKLDPLVIDLQFMGWTAARQNESRIGLYLRKGWEIETI